MAYIDSANIKGTLYELQDTQARTDVAALDSAVESLNAVNGLKKISFTDGYYIPLSGTTADTSNPTPNNAWRYAVVDCAEGDQFTLHVLGSSAGQAYGFASGDESPYTVLLKSAANGVPVDGVVCAPRGATKLIINDRNNPKADSYYGVQSDLSIERLANATEKPTWYIGHVVSNSGEPRYGQHLNNVYQLFTDFVSSDFGLKFSSATLDARWFWYDKETLARVGVSGSFQTAPVYATLSSEYVYRLVVNAGTSFDTAKNLLNHIWDYVTLEKRKSYDTIIDYGATWDWWITPASVDGYGNAYIGYIDTDGFVGVLRRQPDGVMQYRRLESSYNDDDHNGAATLVLDDGRILVMASHGHTTDNHIICWRSVKPYSIDEMERLSFDIPQPGTVTYKTSYMQLFKYNGTLFGFLRVNSKDGDASSITGFGCLISADNGSTWTAYKALNGVGGYQAMTHVADNAKCLKVVCGINPSNGANNFAGCYIDLSTYKVYNLFDNEIGQMVPVDGSSIEDSRCAKKTSMTDLGSQSTSSQIGRLFYGCPTPLAQTVFCFARADDSTNQDFTYTVYNNGTLIEIGKSGIPFGNTHYISGMCFGNDENTVYYAKATTSVADGNHELHKVKLANNAVESDVVICEAPLCLLRPLFVGNGEVAVTLGKYNSLNGGSGNEFTQWTLKPMFVQA